jgi:ATP-binding cassette subfamily C exporter for protease/lipase/ATP-binding cassette subfamily C protein EexD
VRALFGKIWPLIIYAGFFSLVVNVLLLVPPLYMLQLFDRVISSRSEETLVMLTLAAGVALAMMALLDAVRARLFLGCGVALERKLGPHVLDALLAQLNRTGGAAQAAGLRDIAALRAFFVGSPVLALFDAPWLPIFLALIWLFHPLLGAVALGGAVVMLAIAALNERFTRRTLERAQEEGRRAGRFVEASLRNAEAVSALGMHGAVTRRWRALNDRMIAEQIDGTTRGSSFSALTKFARQAIQMLMLGTGAYLVITQRATPGVMLAGTVVLGRALAPVEMLVASWRQLVEARAAWNRLAALLVAEPERARPTELPAPAGELSVERVVFKLADAQRPALQGVSFALRAGESLGLIGPTAAGKSTLARLIVGVWRPGAGAVRLDGADVAAWPREQLARHVGYLPQSVELFPGTVAENIARLGEPDSEAVIRASRRAHTHEMILRLPEGYDTQVGDGGARLAPGQRQRIALARALYGEPKLAVLDEPNSDLDVDGEHALLQALLELKRDRVTVVVIAHRPSLLASVDKLLVLKDGVAELFGPRAEMMARVTRVVPVAKGAA